MEDVRDEERLDEDKEGIRDELLHDVVGLRRGLLDEDDELKGELLEDEEEEVRVDEVLIPG